MNVNVRENVSHTEAKDSIEVALRYIKQQHESNAAEIIVLITWRDLEFKNSLKNFFKDMTPIKNKINFDKSIRNKVIPSKLSILKAFS